MVYKPHHLLAFGGHQGLIEEQWACNIRLAEFGGGSDPFTIDHEQYLTNTAIPALTAWMARTGSKILSTTRLKWIKFNAIGADGLYEDKSTTHERSVDLPAAGTGNVYPLQVCMVLSWRTNAVERGPGSRGRIYSPSPTVSLDPSSRDVSWPDRVLVSDSAALLLNSLDAAVGDPLGGGVLRPVIASGVGEGANNQIDTVVVDSALDIQRRRAYSQSREQTSKAVVY